MITINLRPGQKRKTASGVSPLTAVGEQLRALSGRVKDPLLLLAVAAWVCVGGFLGFVWLRTSTQLGTLEPQLEQTLAEHRRFQTFLAAKRKQEVIRDSLLSQIGTIRSVDGDRYVWPHILDEVAKALPAYTWLVDLATTGAGAAQARTAAAAAAPNAGAKAGKGAKDAKADSIAAAADAAAAQAVEFQISGRTVDIQAYTRFLRQLEASPWLSDVVPLSAQTVIEKERPVTAFQVKATYRAADSAYIRTVPFSQSVR